MTYDSDRLTLVQRNRLAPIALGGLVVNDEVRRYMDGEALAGLARAAVAAATSEKIERLLAAEPDWFDARQAQVMAADIAGRLAKAATEMGLPVGGVQ